jgi:hypothetical protein
VADHGVIMLTEPRTFPFSCRVVPERANRIEVNRPELVGAIERRAI